MLTVGAYEAKTHLSRLLDEVEKGETITITRHGTPVAVLAPPAAHRLSPAEAIENLIAIRARIRRREPGDPTVREMIAEGRS
jgi:prevent-host-death family protein